MAHDLVGRSNELARVKKGNEMAALDRALIDKFVDGDRCCSCANLRPEFQFGHSGESVSNAFSQADDTAGNVPALAMVTVLAPGKQYAVLSVADQQVHIHHRSDASCKKENVFGQSSRRISNNGTQGVDSHLACSGFGVVLGH